MMSERFPTVFDVNEPDEDKAFVGSVGWTPTSIFQTEELSAYVQDARLGARLDAWFQSAWASARRGADKRILMDGSE